MALNDLTRRAASTHIAALADDDESDRLARYQRAWAAYDGEGPQPFEDGDPDNVRLDYARLIVDKGVSFLAGKGGVEFQIDMPEDDSDLQQELDDLDQQEEQLATEPPPPQETPPPAPTGDQPQDAQALDEHNAQAVEAAQAQVEAEHAQHVADETAKIAKKRAQVQQQLQQRQARRALDEAWPEEQRHIDFHQLAQNGGVCGHAWLELFENGRVSVLDPGNVTAVWHEDDVDVLERIIVQWDTVDRDTGMGVVRRKRIEPDVTVDEEGARDDVNEQVESWTVFVEELDDDTGEWLLLDTIEWPHPYPKVLGCQNLPAANTYYGCADLEPAILDQIEQLESLASDMRRICRLHGHPVPVIIGEEASRLQNIDVAVGTLLAIPSKDAKLDQLAIAELTSLLANYQELKTSLFESAHVPKVALGDTTNAGPTAAVALQVEYAPLVERTETKRLTFGMLLRQTAENVLDLLGYPGYRVTLGWPQLLPVDEAADVAAAEADLRMGIVSKQTISEKRGYDWKLEQERLEDQKAEEPDAMTRLLGQLAQPGAPDLNQPPTLPGVPVA